MMQQITIQAKELLAIARQGLNYGIIQCERRFNDFAQNIDFTCFCVIYALLLIWVLRKVNQKKPFRAKNRELMDTKTRIKNRISAFFISLPIIRGYVNKKFQKGLDEIEAEVTKDIEKDRDPARARVLPPQGMKKQNLQSRITKWAQSQNKRMLTGKHSGTIYPQSPDFCKQVVDFAAKYMYHNPLHLEGYKQVVKMQAQLLRMTGNMISKDRVYGVVVSGGSEGLIMTLRTYKTLYNKQRPNVVVPHSIHAAIDKGCSYFNIEVRKARLNKNFEVDLKHMESLIDSNTIAIYGSYPSYPHGICDPIKQLGKMAKKHNVGFHIDGCLGGFIAGFLPQHRDKFTLDIQGATSITLDHHKFGLAPKGVSAVFFKTRQLRQHMYYFYTEWSGGLYGTPSFVGSRPGFASAGAWYALTHYGMKSYMDNANNLARVTKLVANQLRDMEDVEVFGNPDLCVVAFDTTSVNIYEVTTWLQKNKNWSLAAIHYPKGAHIGITPANLQNVQKSFSNDLKEAIEYLKKNGVKKQSTTAAFYGASAQLPVAEMGDDVLRHVIKCMFR